jgi:glycerophosphoryl diester phosphodiesterase
LAAYEGAVAQGADGFECDLRLTKDEVPVLWHNSSALERAGNPGLIAEMSFRELSRAYPTVMQLEEFLLFAVANKKSVLLESKHPVISGNRIEEVIVETMGKVKNIEQINLNVMSFSWFAIEKMRRIDSTIATTFLLHERTPWRLAKLSSAKAIGPGIEQLRAQPILAQKAKDLGRSLNVWTVDHPSDIQLCQKLGVDILITNKPAQAREALRYP